jgi:AraC family transcriptional regulator
MDVKIEHIEPFRVAFMRHVGPYDTCGSTWERFCSVLGPRGLISDQSVFLGICHDDPEVTPPDKVRYDACMRVDEGFEPPEEIAVQEVDGGDYAVVTHHGPFDRLAETYAFVYGQWLPQSKRDLRAAPGFEIYLNDPGSTPPEELLIELHIPLEPASP